MYANNPETRFPQRRVLRLRDYRSPGSYFVTIYIVQTCWQDIPLHYPLVDNDVFIVMPNHVHGIIRTRDEDGRSGPRPAPTEGHPLSEIVRAFKTFSARGVNETRASHGAPRWQRGYYEHVIRSEEEYYEVGQYIIYNPQKWDTDTDNPDRRL